MVFSLISEIIEGVSVLFSGGVDGTIKMWNTELEDHKESNYVTTLFAHKGTVLSLAFSRTRNVLISSSSDMTIRMWKLDDNFDKIINPLFHCIATIKDFVKSKTKEEVSPFWINTLSLKETDAVELYAGDTSGKLHLYEYYDLTSAKNMDSNHNRIFQSRDNKKMTQNNFNYIKTFNVHSRTTIKIVHSIFDSMIYSIGFDNCLIGFNTKENASKNIFNHRTFKYCEQQ